MEVVGRHKEGDRTIEGRLVQKTMLVRGDNNREVWSYVGNRMAVAVTEPVPFHVEIVPPKVPLVQNGNMELKVTATRDGGFKGPIALRMLYNPPGVSSPDSVTIPEGQTAGGHSAHGRRRRGAADLEDCRAGRIDDGRWAAGGLVATGRLGSGRAAAAVPIPAGRGRAGPEDEHRREDRKDPQARSAGGDRVARPAQRGDERAAADRRRGRGSRFSDRHHRPSRRRACTRRSFAGPW